MGLVRNSEQEKARSRERIIDVAAEQVRVAGLQGPGIAEVMHAAGMTHGGFYKHFASRDDLVLAAVQRAFDSGTAAMAARLQDTEDPLAAFVDWYVSAEHVADPGGGCAVAALGCEMPRAGDRVRAAYTAQVTHYLDALEPLVGSRTQATAALSTLTGAVTIARAVDSPVLAAEILRAVRAALKAQVPS